MRREQKRTQSLLECCWERVRKRGSPHQETFRLLLLSRFEEAAESNCWSHLHVDYCNPAGGLSIDKRS